MKKKNQQASLLISSARNRERKEFSFFLKSVTLNIFPVELWLSRAAAYSFARSLSFCFSPYPLYLFIFGPTPWLISLFHSHLLTSAHQLFNFPSHFSSLSLSLLHLHHSVFPINPSLSSLSFPHASSVCFSNCHCEINPRRHRHHHRSRPPPALRPPSANVCGPFRL